jgi:hypothetical protein
MSVSRAHHHEPGNVIFSGDFFLINLFFQSFNGVKQKQNGNSLGSFFFYNFLVKGRKAFRVSGKEQ